MTIVVVDVSIVVVLLAFAWLIRRFDQAVTSANASRRAHTEELRDHQRAMVRAGKLRPEIFDREAQG